MRHWLKEPLFTLASVLLTPALRDEEGGCGHHLPEREE